MACRFTLNFLAYFGALSAVFSPAVLRADTSKLAPTAHAQHDGVILDAYSDNDRIIFCFNADKDVKIASQYGIEFKVPRTELNLWGEKMPKLVAGSAPYFDLPVRIELKTRGAPRDHQISIDLGVCVAAKVCTPVTLEISIPAQKSAASENISCPK